MVVGFQRWYRIVGSVCLQHPTPRVRHRAYHIHSEEREQWRKFHSITPPPTADSDQCRPRGWHHQLQIAPPPLSHTVRSVIAPTRAKVMNELGKKAPLSSVSSRYSFFFSKFDNALARTADLISIIGRGTLSPQFLHVLKLFLAARRFSYHHSSIVVTAHSRTTVWIEGCVKAKGSSRSRRS